MAENGENRKKMRIYGEGWRRIPERCEQRGLAASSEMAVPPPFSLRPLRFNFRRNSPHFINDSRFFASPSTLYFPPSTFSRSAPPLQFLRNVQRRKAPEPQNFRIPGSPISARPSFISQPSSFNVRSSHIPQFSRDFWLAPLLPLFTHPHGDLPGPLFSGPQAVSHLRR